MKQRALWLFDRLYRLSLFAYPVGYRRTYGSLMAQVFRDLCRDAYGHSQLAGLVKLYLVTLIDTAKNAVSERIYSLERMTLMQKKSILALGLALICAVLTGYVNLTATEVQAPMLCLLLFGFVLGFYQPRGAWRWALIVGLSVASSYFVADAFRVKLTDAPHFPIGLVVLVIPTLIATYVGVGLRRLVSSQLSSTV